MGLPSCPYEVGIKYEVNTNCLMDQITLARIKWDRAGGAAPRRYLYRAGHHVTDDMEHGLTPIKSWMRAGLPSLKSLRNGSKLALSLR